MTRLPSSPSPALEPGAAEAIARLVLAAVRRPYPSQISHVLFGDEDARPPRELTPAFFGSYDWHSAVHGHWCLARLVRGAPDAPFAEEARQVLTSHLTRERTAAEIAYLGPRPGFERPYGLAWLLQLGAELGEWDDPDARVWRGALEPLESLAAERLGAWLPTLRWPVRSGMHNQTAFALGLTRDWARRAGAGELTTAIDQRSRQLFGEDRDAPIDYEPSGVDFLSGVLGEADLMRRVLPGEEFAAWLDRFLPDLASPRAQRWLTPVASPDPSDGQLAHLDGLNLSRAWMLEGIASALPDEDARVPRLAEASARHREKGLAAVTGDHYAGSHWLGTFAVYLLTRRGIG